MPVTNSNTSIVSYVGYKFFNRNTPASDVYDAMGYEITLADFGTYGSTGNMFLYNGYGSGSQPIGGQGAFNLTINADMAGFSGTLNVVGTDPSYGNDRQDATFNDVDFLKVVLPTGWSYAPIGTVMTLGSPANRYTVPRQNPADGEYRYTNGDVQIYDENNNPVFVMKLVGWESLGDGGLGEIFVCFTKGAQILLADGRRQSVENLKPGTMVMTKDRGPQKVRAVLNTPVSAQVLEQFPERRPVRIKAGTFGDHDDNLVSPQHRVLVQSDLADILYDSAEVLVPAKSLIDSGRAEWADDVDHVVYYHVIFENHEIVNADGLWSESYQVGKYTVDAASEPVRKELEILFPELENEDSAVNDSARVSLKPRELAVIGL